MDPVTCCPSCGGFSVSAAGLPMSPFTMSCKAAVGSCYFCPGLSRPTWATFPAYDLHDCSSRTENCPSHIGLFTHEYGSGRGAVHQSSCANKMFILTNSSWLSLPELSFSKFVFLVLAGALLGKLAIQVKVIRAFLDNVMVLWGQNRKNLKCVCMFMLLR